MIEYVVIDGNHALCVGPFASKQAARSFAKQHPLVDLFVVGMLHPATDEEE